MKQKTVLASSIAELDTMCNEFSKTHNVKASQMRAVQTPDGLLLFETLWYADKQEDALDTNLNPTAKPVWRQCNKCKSFVNIAKWNECKCGCDDLRVPEKKK